MIARDRGRRVERLLLGLATVGALGVAPVLAQQAGRTAARPGQGQVPAQPQAEVKMVRIPVMPNDPVATVNGEVITRQQLADECVTRKGEEILETLIARKLIEQAIRVKHLEVKAAEIDAEIERVAQTMAGVSREAWLRTLAKERNISPAQYARDIIYPALALRKLAEPKVQVTEKDIAEAFEAQYGDKLRCRIIMTGQVEHAKQVWEELKKNPGNFEKIAQNDPRSIDAATRSMGGMLTEPIPRYAYPRTVSDAAFAQLVDPDTVSKSKPKDGDFTGPIQVTTSSWVIIQRVGVIPAQRYDASDPVKRKMLTDSIKETKIKEEMEKVYSELLGRAAIDNKLTGRTNSVAKGEEDVNAPNLDKDVKLMSDPNRPAPKRPDAAGTAATATAPAGRGAKLPAPKGVSEEDLRQAEALKK
jgi:foldase protein PrsA